MPLADIEQAIKSALLSRDKRAVDTLKGVKTALQYEAVAKQKKIDDLSEEEIATVLQRELKKRREAAELYEKAASPERAAAELEEAEVISKFLPKQLSDADISKHIEEAADQLGHVPTIQDMGRLIGYVKQAAGASADGASVARLVKEFIERAAK